MKMETITIEKNHFDLLLRRAQLNSEFFANEHDPDAAGVSIPQAEYDRLSSIARKYENLRYNLVVGGVSLATLDLLSEDHTAAAEAGDNTPGVTSDPSPAKGSMNPTASSFFEPPRAVHRNGQFGGYNDDNVTPHPHEHVAWADRDAEEEEDGILGGQAPVEEPVPVYDNYAKTTQPQRQQYERHCLRTVLLANLADGTTHADITAAVRGGFLLDVFVRPYDHSATVSFVHADEARKFLDHCRKHDLYIKNKRVDVKWSERQFVLPGHVAGKINIGASRNLVIRRVNPKHTEESIRDDLEHIHNCVAVKVEFSAGNCYLSLNSIHTAIYARMCMMSRLKYKGSKIEWDVDECAQPYPDIHVHVRRSDTGPVLKKRTTMANRFQALQLEDSGEDEIEIPVAFRSKKHIDLTA